VALAAAACSGLSRVAKTHEEGAGHRFRMFGSLFRAAPAHVQLPAKCQAKHHTRGLHQAKHHTRGLNRSQTRKQMQDNKKPYKDTCTASGNRPTVGAPYARARCTRAGRVGRVARPAYAQFDRRGAGKQQSASYHAPQLRARRRSRASRSTPGARPPTSTILPPPALATGELHAAARSAAQLSTRETKL
jgi:hypothetical protein